MCIIFLGDSQYPEQADHVQETGRGSADCHRHRSPAGGQPTAGPNILSQSRGKTALQPQVLCVILHLFFAPYRRMIFYKGFLPIARTVFLLREFSSCREITRAMKQFSDPDLMRLSGFGSAFKTLQSRMQICCRPSLLRNVFLGFIPRRILATDNWLLSAFFYVVVALSLEMYRTSSQEIGMSTGTEPVVYT